MRQVRETAAIPPSSQEIYIIIIEVSVSFQGKIRYTELLGIC